MAEFRNWVDSAEELYIGLFEKQRIGINEPLKMTKGACRKIRAPFIMID